MKNKKFFPENQDYFSINFFYREELIWLCIKNISGIMLTVVLNESDKKW